MSETLGAAIERTLSAGEAGGGGTVAERAAPLAGSARYERLDELGRGGMGRVLVARDHQFGRRVAVKELLAAGNPEAARRFHVEALVTGNLEHPGIPTVYERGQSAAGEPFYAMRLVSGRTLADALAEAKTLADRLKLLPVVTRAAQAVAYAHHQGVVHRDIKPQNIVVGPYGESVVLDWGIAKVRGLPIAESGLRGDAPVAEAAATQTADGAVLGTPAYMAPEQAVGKVEAIDERTDVFALGALLYHLLAGRPPYSAVGGAVAAVMHAGLADYEPLSRVAPSAPAGLRAVCERAMARAQSERYGDAAEFVAALESVTAEAIGGRGAQAVRWFAGAASTATIVLLLLAAAFLWHEVSSLTEQGTPALLYTGMSVVGCVLSAIEWRTRGRHALGPLALGIALATLFLGLATFGAGVGEVAHAVGREEVVTDALRFRRILMQGAWECAGSLSTSALLASVQIALWGVARRRMEARPPAE